MFSELCDLRSENERVAYNHNKYIKTMVLLSVEEITYIPSRRAPAWVGRDQEPLLATVVDSAK